MSCLHARITTAFARGGLCRLIVPVLLLFVLAMSASTATAQVNVKGQWSTLPYLMPINPVHMALMYNGKILVVSGSGNDPSNSNLQAAVWDPQAGTITVQTVNWDMFCNGMVVLPDGRPFIVGGTLQYDPFFGEAKSAVFDPATNTFTDMQNMAHGRWYPSVTTLGDGRVLTFSGSDDVTGATNTTVEIFTLGSGWSTPYNASWTPALYPRMYLLPNGKVFYAGPSVTTRLFDTTAHTWTTVGNTIFGNSRTYGSTVLLPLTPANGYDPQVISMGGGSPATMTTETIDLGAATPVWKQGPQMSQGRIEMNAVMLPNGKVLAVGGSLVDEQASGASLNADLYDPATNSFTTMAPNAYARLYHSNALLLPDATVWFAGGNPVRGTYEQHLEIYQPPYLFNADGSAAARPAITSLPSAITWAGSFTVSTPDAANISSVVLIRPGAPTHAFDMDQRLVGMSFTKGSGTLTVTAPPNGNIAPPGYYMLFLVNSSGVPSVAKFTKLSGSGGGNPAPSVTSITPNSGTTAGGTTVNITGTGFLAGATVNMGGNTATGVTVVNNTSITATTPAHAAGAVNVIVTNTDSQSGSLTNGYTYTASSGGGGIAFVQVGSATPQSPAAAVILSYPLPQTAGNTNLVVVGWSDNVASLNSLTDSRGNTYVQAGTTINGTGIRQAIYYAKNIAGGSNTLTASFSQAAAYVDLRVLEYSGLDTTNPLDVATGASGTSASPNSGAATTTSATEMIFGAGTTGNSFKAAGSGFVSRIITSPDGDVAEDKLVTSTGSNSATATLNSSSTWVMQMATFRASGQTQPPPNPAPKVTSIAPNTGTANGGTAVTITGTGFLAGATVTLGGTSATGVTVVSSTSITATTPAHAAGAVTVSVTNTDTQSGSLTNGFTYTAVNPAPALTSTTPNTGTTAGGTAITIKGTGFLAGATVSLGGTAATGVTVVSSTSITATTPAHAAGAVTVSVTNTDTQSGSLTNGYTYTTANPAPTVTVVNPNTGTTAGGTAITITGTGFLSGATVRLGGTAATGVIVVGSTSITATTAAHAAGAVSVSVTNTDAQSGSLTNGYTYTAANPAPTVTAVNPNTGTTAGGTAITIAGTGFQNGATVSLGGTAAAGVTVVSSSSITATTAAHAAGAVSVSVTNTDSQSGALANGYTYTSSTGGGPIAFVQVKSTTPQTPTASVAVTYPLAQTAGNLNIVVVGWSDATSTLTSLTDTRGNTYVQAGTAITGTNIRQAIYYAKNIAGGSNTVTAVFNQAAAYPDVRVLEYSGLDTTSPLDVTSSASGNGATANSGSATTTSPTELIFGAGNTANAFRAAGTGFTSRIITQDGDIGEDKQVNSTGSYSATGAIGSSAAWVMQMATFRASGQTQPPPNPSPTVTSVAPNTGTSAGGTAVTITGTGFLSGATVSIGGTAATGVTVVSSTSITATVPAHAAGAVNVSVTNTDNQTGTLTNGYTYTTSTGGSIAFVQVNSTTPQTPTASVAVTYPAAQTAGNLNIVVVGWNDTTATLTSLTDTRGNTYVQAGTMVSGTAIRQAIYYAKNIAAGSNTVTAVFSQAANYPDVRVLEYSGLDTTSPLDVTAGAFGTSITANSGAATTASAKELIFGAGTTGNAFGNAGTGFTSRTITQDGDIAEDKQVTSTGSNSASGAFSSSSTWVMQMATFKATQ